MLAVAPPVVRLEATVRSGDAGETVVTLAPDRRVLYLSLPDLYLPADTELTIELLDSAGKRVAENAFSYGDLLPRRSIVLVSAAAPLEAGVYRIRVTATAAPNTAAIPPPEYRIRLRSTAAR